MNKVPSLRELDFQDHKHQRRDETHETCQRGRLNTSERKAPIQADFCHGLSIVAQLEWDLAEADGASPNLGQPCSPDRRSYQRFMRMVPSLDRQSTAECGDNYVAA